LVQTAATLWDSTPARIIDEHERHAVFVAQTSRGESVVIKATSNPEQAIQIENEVQASSYLGELISSRRYRFPLPWDEKAKRKGDVSAAAYDFIPDVTWFATKFPTMHLEHPMSDEGLNDLMSLMKILHAMRAENIPACFLHRAAQEFTDEHYREKLKGYLEPVIGAACVSPDQASTLLSMACDAKIVRRFQHHDLVPWNLGRDAEGRLVVVDAEFARWGMAYYDVAYAFLQIYFMLGDADLAHRWLMAALKTFKSDTFPIEQAIWQPMAYRFGANLHEAIHRPDQMKRAQALLPSILSRNLSGLFSA
jgi:hypothetical protein